MKRWVVRVDDVAELGRRVMAGELTEDEALKRLDAASIEQEVPSEQEVTSDGVAERAAALAIATVRGWP